MGKAAVKIVSVALAGVMLVLVGMRIGIQSQAKYELDTYRTVTMQNTTLAVTNQDMGVAYGGEDINFAQSVIDTLGDECVLVSPAAGAAGLANGAYGALISFPADFSSKLAGINSKKPEKASFRYQINPNLSQKNTIEVLLRVMELETQINSNMSLLYTASVLGELHSAQDTVMALLENEQASLDAVRSFATAEMIPQLEIGFMEREFPKINYTDLSEYTTRNSNILTQANEKYTEYLRQTSDDFTAVRDSVSGSIGINNLADSINNMEMLPLGEGEASGFTNQFAFVQAQAEIETIQIFLTLAGDINAARGGMETAIGASGMGTFSLGISSLGISEILGFSANQRAAIDVILASFSDAMYARILEYTAAAVEIELSQTPIGISLGLSLQAVGIDLPGVLRTLSPLGMSGYQRTLLHTAGDDLMHSISSHIDPLLLAQAIEQRDSDLTSINIHMDSYYDNMTLALTQAFKIDIPVIGQLDLVGSSIQKLQTYIKNRQNTETSRLNAAASAFGQTLTAMAGQVTGFDPLKRISENSATFSAFNSDFNENNSEWEKKVSEALELRTTFIFDTYEQYEEYVQQLRDSMQLTTEEAEALLADQLALLLSSQLTSNDNNVELIDVFAGKLPNSRIGSQGNTDLYSFIVSPVQLNEVGQGSQTAFRTPAQKYTSDALNNVELGMYLVAGAVILLIAICTLTKILRRRQNRKLSMETAKNAKTIE